MVRVQYYIIIIQLIIDIELDYDEPFLEDLCGTCTDCIDACPTNALEEYILDSNKCISYLTIEHRGEFLKDSSSKLEGWIYGCDICQDVCPWNNKFSKKSEEAKFFPREDIINKDIYDWEKITEDDFKLLFKRSAITRTKYSGLKRNINTVINNIKDKC